MALKSTSMFLYGLAVTASNRFINFKAASGGVELTASLATGYYTLSELADLVAASLNAADPARTYTVTVDRTVNGGTENRITISTSGSFLSILFASGTLAASSARDLLGFGIFDFTGNTTYTNGISSGITLLTEFVGYNYKPPQIWLKNFGSVNVSTSGQKESITWQIQQFIGVEFRYEPEAKVLTEWADLVNWMIQQKEFEFTPQTSIPGTIYQVTLESSTEDGKGLGFNMAEMLPQFPFLYQTGAMKFRVKVS